MITPEQTRAARCLLDWRQQDLADAAGVGLSTVHDFEAGRRTPRHGNLDAIRRALEAAGVGFLDSGQGGPGVYLGEAQAAQAAMRRHTDDAEASGPAQVTADATGGPHHTRFEFRTSRSWMVRLDAWRLAQVPPLTRAEAVRHLVDTALGLNT